jgi:hypothetical protein
MDSTRSVLDGLVRSLHSILEASRSGGSTQNGSSLASGPVSFLLAMEIEEKSRKAKDCL